VSYCALLTFKSTDSYDEVVSLALVCDTQLCRLLSGDRLKPLLDLESVAQSPDDFIVGAYGIRPSKLSGRTGTLQGASLAPLQK
jgi:hypothetical protein